MKLLKVNVIRRIELATHKFPDKISGEFIELRKVTMDDAYNIYRWRTSKSGRYMRQPDGYSLESQKQWISSRDENEVNYIICSLTDSEKVGIYRHL